GRRSGTPEACALPAGLRFRRVGDAAGPAPPGPATGPAPPHAPRSGRTLRPDENLRVVLGRTEVDEGLGDAVETDLAGDERRGGNLSLGEVTQGGRELVRRVPEHELQIELLADAEHGVDGVRLHAHADDHDARAAWRGGHELVEHAGHADALEDDGGA